MTAPGNRGVDAWIFERFAPSKVLGVSWPDAADLAPDDGVPDLVVDSEAADRPPLRFGGVQQAVDQAIRDIATLGPERRRRILLRPGFYPGPVLIPKSAPPLSIVGPGSGQATLAAGIDAGMSGRGYGARFGARFQNAPPSVREIHARIAARGQITTGNTAVLRIARDGTRVDGLTIRNDYACDRAASAPAGAESDAQGRFAEGQHQAVALHVAGATHVHLAGLHLTSYQDTLYLQAASDGAPTHVQLEDCLIEGDVDFIFGGATAFFEACEIRARGTRGAPIWALAPNTALRQPYGFVFENCRFTHDGAEAGRAGRSFLGRQWFEGVRATPYGAPTVPGYRTIASDTDRYDPPTGQISRRALEAVGKTAVLNSTFGPHLDPRLAPGALWDAWAAGPWSPRYRPAQHTVGDFRHLLTGWLTENGLDYSDLDPAEPWLVHAGCRRA